MSASKPVLTCGCGRAYDAEQWKALRLAGHAPQYNEDGTEHATLRLELRNCVCGSTRAIEVPK